jgi:hypothetical protein
MLKGRTLPVAMARLQEIEKLPIRQATVAKGLPITWYSHCVGVCQALLTIERSTCKKPQ